MIALEYEMTYRLKVTGPLAATDGSPVGAREYWEMTKATSPANTSRQRSQCLEVTGWWWSWTAWTISDVRVQFMTDDGATIFLHYTGLVERTDAFTKAAETGPQLIGEISTCA